MGFLRQGEGVGFIEGMTTSPDASSEDRNEALDTLFKHLLYFAQRMGIKKVVGYSINDGMVKRAERLGFVAQKHTILSKELGE